MTFENLIDKPNELFQLINDKLIPKELEKKQFGEVYTPLELVNEMLDKLPIEVWKNINLKWLEPSSGIGNFTIIVYLRLMESLKDIILNAKKRKKHILENMLYMCELNIESSTILKQIFNSEKYKLNIFVGDFFESVFNINHFDIIYGNPPYQKENKKTLKARGGTNNNFYLDFVDKSLNLLTENGYLLFIHPLNWRKIGSPVIDKFLNKDIVYLKLNYGGHFFKNVSVKTDYYVLKNSKNEEHISVFEDNNSNISKFKITNTIKFIPNIYNEHINSIFQKINTYGKKYECIISSDCHKVRDHVKKGSDEIYKYKLYNTSGNPFDYFSLKPHKHQDLKKVILSNSGKLAPFYDSGEYGTTQDSMYILVESKREGEAIINTINSKLFTFLIKICQWGNFRNEASLFSYLKYVDSKKVKKNKIHEDYINKYFNLSLEEIEYIN